MKTQIAALQTVTSAGALAGADVSAIIGDWTLILRVTGLAAASGTPGASIVIEGSTNGFSTATQLATVQVAGPIVADACYSWRRYQTDPNASPVGIMDGELRVNVAVLGGSSPALTFSAELDS